MAFPECRSEDKAAMIELNPEPGLTAAWNQIQGRRGNWIGQAKMRSAAIGPLSCESNLALFPRIKIQVLSPSNAG